MIKEKPCRGTGKAKGYGCGELQFKRRYGLGYKCGCFNHWLVSTPEGKETLKKSTLKAKKQVKTKVIREARERKREWKQKHKSIQKLIQEARRPFQKWIRQRDNNRPCISCGNHYADIYDAGHYFKAELYSGMIFDEDNVHKQCRKCNSYLGGNESAYKTGLELRYGKEYVDNLTRKANERRDYRYSREELIEIKTKYQKKCKQN